MANEEHNQQCQLHMMKLCDDTNMKSNITPLTYIIHYNPIEIVVRDNDDILGAILLFLDVIKLSQKSLFVNIGRIYAK